MNSKLFSKPKAFKKMFSMIALVAFISGGFSGLIYTSTAHANNGINTFAVPNTGTLTPGQNLEVHLTVSLDPNDANPVTSSSCLVNGVDVANTFENLTSGTDGHFKFTYTVGAGDASWAAGQVPISCTLHQTGSVTVTGFDDGNSVAIDTSSNAGENGGDTGGEATTTPATLSFDSVAATPNTGTLHIGDTLQIALSAHDAISDAALSGACTVNDVDVSGSFQNLGGGSYALSYIVASGDTSRVAGQIPVSCAFQASSGATTTVASFTDSNTVAIDVSSNAGGSGGDGGSGANDGINTYVNPNTGTLHAGDTLEVHMTVPLDPNDTNPITSPSCLVNGVDVASSFENLTTGSDGHFKFAYTVGSNDASRAAGQLPISCTLHQTGSVTVTGFDDNNTVAVDTSSNTGGTGGNNGGDTGGSGTTTAPVLSSFTIMPYSGSISADETAEVTFTEAHSFEDLALAGTCKVNLRDVSNTFQNLGGGHYRVTYTVQPGDAERPAGWTLIDCTLGNANGTVTAHHPWQDGNSLAIDTNGDGSISNGTSTLGFTVTANPSSGMLDVGDVLTVFFQDPLPSPDLTVGSAGCRVNDVDVANTFVHTGNGLYKVTYTVGAHDSERAPGQVPVDCSMQNNTGSVHLVSFTDGNTVGIDTTPTDGNGGNTGGNATSTIEVGAVPNTGVRTAGQNVEVYFEATSTANNLTLGGACTVNGVDVSGTFQNLTGGLYRVVYTVGSNDAEKTAGSIPVNCTLSDGSSNTILTAFTDGNTLAIDTNNDGFITAHTSPYVSQVTANPFLGTLHAGEHLEVYIKEGTENPNFIVSTSTACTVNGVDVASSFENLTTGVYKLTYNVSANDQSRAAGQVPLDCTLADGTDILAVNSFTDGNVVAIDASSNAGGDNGSGGTTTPSLISAAEIVPSSGTVGAGASLDIYFNATNGANDLTLGGACTVNGVDVSGSFANLAGGLYQVNYTVGQSDVERAAGQIPVSCAFANPSGATTTVSAFTDNNTLAIDIAENSGGNDGGNAGGDNGGDTGGTGTTTPDTGGNGGTGGNNGGDTGGNNGTSTPITFTYVAANPNTGMRYQGDHLFVHFQSATNADDLSLGGACTVNGVSVGPLENINNGQYRVDYLIGPNDTERDPGTVPINCVIQNSTGATTTVSAFTDGNMVAIDTNHDGAISGGTGGSNNGVSTTTPQISWASITPNSGVLTSGDTGRVYFQEFHHQSDLAIGGTCEINGVTMTGLDNLGSGLYRLNYVVGSEDRDREAGQIPITCVLKNGSNLTTTIVALDPNSLAIDVNGNGSYTDGSIGGSVETGTLGVASIAQVKASATAGAGFEGGWQWVFHVTVPSNEPSVRMKFGDWQNSNGSSTITMGGNMRISSEQASSTEPITLNAAGIYSDAMTITGDLDPNTPGKQIDIKVEMQIPEGTENGAYGTYYGIQSTP